VLCAPLRLERCSFCNLPQPLLLSGPKRRLALSNQARLLALTSCECRRLDLPRRRRLCLSRCSCGLRCCLPTPRLGLALLG
jgi:hypothetical protein